MSGIIDFGNVEKLSINVLVDNMADHIMKSTSSANRFTEKYLLAEHGLSMLIDINDVGERIMWDTGATKIALIENMKSMGIDPVTVTKIALSHGHKDHTTGLMSMLKKIKRQIPVVAHPEIFLERWRVKENGRKELIPLLPREKWEAKGAELILSKGHYELAPGCWTTGMVPRRSFEKSGISSWVVVRQGNEYVQDNINDDQAIVVNLKDKGLVIISGCAHSGIVNTIEYARKISGVDKVRAIIGGFHLARSNLDEIKRTIDAIKSYCPSMVVPMHCTGFKAICEFSVQMPEEFVLGLVGTTYRF
ncbi:MAG: MBL fold metallo-hydrolase [Bacillota bacterium]|nr:MBL fold metallo-hydrolase [Bacillota bacterium]